MSIVDDLVPLTRRPRFGLSFAERFWQHVDITVDGCWTWTASLMTPGYGQFGVSLNRRPDRSLMVPAHRVAYELAYGPIPQGLLLDHLCRQHACVRPNHLEAVTQRENLRRGVGASGINARKTHCNAGHPLSGTNLYLRPDKKGRDCLTCRRDTARRARARADMERAS